MKNQREAHVNIPVFIPHLGCPNMCVFCNQRFISGVDQFRAEDARDEIEKILSTVRGTDKKCEIAFFGGSFTGIDRKLMISLLDLAEEYVSTGEVSGIRMSTRPDYIDGEIIDILSRYTISAVELGIQSFDDTVLQKSKRGHTAEDSTRALTMLKNAGFRTVGQMMIGLPGSTPLSERECAEKICALGASEARIYPTIVFRSTELSESADRGEYIPLSLEDAVSRSADVLEIFTEHNVEVLRIGLCESENLHSAETYYAGPNHSSIGELVYSEVYLRKLCSLSEKSDIKDKNIVFSVPRGDLSQAVGQRRKNKNYIKDHYGAKSVKFSEDCTLAKFQIRINITDQGEENCT